MPCSAKFLVHQNLALQGYLLCVLYVPYCCGCAVFAFSHLSPMILFAAFEQGLVPVLLVGQSGATSGFS